MVAPGEGFRGGTLYRPKYRRRPKKKGLRSKTSWFSIRKYVMTKKKVFVYQSLGFRSQKKKNPNGVTPKWVTPGAGRPPSDATVARITKGEHCWISLNFSDNSEK